MTHCNNTSTSNNTTTNNDTTLLSFTQRSNFTGFGVDEKVIINIAALNRDHQYSMFSHTKNVCAQKVARLDLILSMVDIGSDIFYTIIMFLF